MAGPFDWARYVTGDRDNPEEDIGQWSDENQKRNRAALGLDANGNPLPAAAAAAPAAPSPGAPTPGAPTALPGANPAADGSAPPDPSQQAAAQAQASSTLPPNQEPNATKTPVSLGHMMMNLQQYNEREQGFNQALGMGFAAFAQPRDRDMVSKMFNTTPADPMKIAQTQMSLGQQQQGQDRANAITTIANDQSPAGQAKFAALASQLHMDWGALKAGLLTDPGMAGKIAQALGTPTPGMATLTQLNNMPGGGPGGPGGPGGTAGSTISDIKSGIVGDLGGAGNSAMIQAQNAWRAAHQGQPDSAMPWTPNSIQSFNQYTINEKGKEDDRATASNELNDKNLSAMTLQGDLEQLKNSPGLKMIMTTPGHSVLAQKALNDGNVVDVPSIMAKYSLSSDEANAVALLRRIGGSTTESAMKSMAGTGTRVTQAEVGPLKDAITTTQNLNQGYDQYLHSAVNGALTRTKKVIAANYGNTGNVTNMPTEYAPWLDDSFLKGGQLYKEGSGADAIAPPKLIPRDLLASVKQEAIAYPVGKEDLLDNLQQQGFDTKRLRRSDPSTW